MAKFTPNLDGIRAVMTSAESIEAVTEQAERIADEANDAAATPREPAMGGGERITDGFAVYLVPNAKYRATARVYARGRVAQNVQARDNVLLKVAR